MTMTKKNLLIVTTTFPASVDDAISARFVFDLASSLTAYFNVHVLSPSSPGAKKFEDMSGVKVHRFRYFVPGSLQLLTTGDGILASLKKNIFLSLQLPFLLISEFISAISVIKKEKIDVVNSHWIIPQGLIIAVIKRPLGVRHILTVHAADIFLLKRLGKIGSMLARYIVRRSDKVIAVSNYIKSVIDGLVNEDYDFEIMPMGVRVELFDDRKTHHVGTGKRLPDTLRILFVGKMAEKKGLKFLLEALTIVKKKNRSFTLDVVGGGLLEDTLKDHASNLGLDKEINFRGWIANEKLPELYKDCDIVAIPSVFDKNGETEGMPVVVLEAMAMSRPVLASRISGIPDVVTDGYNGWLTEPGDAAGMSARIEEIYGLDLDAYRKNAFKTVEKFSCEKVAAKYKEAIG
ncbi:MAG: glycosyltransferase [Candidatus Omnitrophota bacterium]|nr:glycosyltransferase [Candidatus Omnitrophota bacterium]